MAIKDTGDYLTARGANPRTGLISPSVATVQTPCTPMTPGEALRLYSHFDTQDSTKGVDPRLLAKRVPGKHDHPPASQWKQCEKGWFMETVARVPSPSATTANTSASHDNYLSPEDRFIIPMPSAKEPRPYRDPSHTAEQIAALEHYREKSSRRVSPSGLNGRMFSIGAGPRKFAEASKKLQTHALERQSPRYSRPVRREEQHGSTSPDIATAVPLQPLRTCSSGSLDSVMVAMQAMPGGYGEITPSSPQLISRRPVASPPRTNARRGSDATVITATWLEEKEVWHGSDASPDRHQPRPTSNTDRFHDMRQLPRVRIVHPDLASLPRNTSNRSTDSGSPVAMKRIFTPPVGSKAMPLPYPIDSIMPSSETPPASKLDAGPSSLESRLMTAVTCITSLPHQISQVSWKTALNTLTNEKADPLQRLDAAKMLLSTIGKVLMLVGVAVAVVKIGVAVWQVLEMVFWPVRMLLVIVRWMFGFGSSSSSV